MRELKIYLIRHGKTDANERRLYCGKSDLSLSKNGIEELNELRSKVNYPCCDEYFTSGAKRANETFVILYPNFKYKIDNRFWEYDFGDFEMKSYDMLKENEEYIKWISDSEGQVSCPNGESKSQYVKRIQKSFNKLIDNCFKDNINSVLLLCHGGTIGTILEVFYDNSKSFYEHQPSCGRGYEIVVINNSENGFEVKSVNKI